MQEIIFDSEFKGLLPSLDAKTFGLLEENILENGCRDPLVLWDDILIDGHNRYEICMKYDIPFTTVSREFASRDEVVIWIIKTQISRRNLSPTRLSYYRGVHYRTEKKIRGSNNQYVLESEKPQNGVFQNVTTARLAEEYNVSKNTIGRDARASEAVDAIGEISPEDKRMILDNEVKIDKKVLESLTSGPVEAIGELADCIENRTYVKPKADSAAEASDESGSAGVSAGPSGGGPRLIDTARLKMSDDIKFYNDLRKRVVSSDVVELKKSLRSYIDSLEDLFNQI